MDRMVPAVASRRVLVRGSSETTRTPVIRTLTPADAPAYVELRRGALTLAPFAFAASPADDPALSAPFVREKLASPAQAIFGTFVPELVGVVGIYRADHDEYTTIFGAKKGHVSNVATALANAGFSRVDGYEPEW